MIYFAADKRFIERVCIKLYQLWQLIQNAKKRLDLTFYSMVNMV